MDPDHDQDRDDQIDTIGKGIEKQSNACPIGVMCKGLIVFGDPPAYVRERAGWSTKTAFKPHELSVCADLAGKLHGHSSSTAIVVPSTAPVDGIDAGSFHAVVGS